MASDLIERLKNLLGETHLAEQRAENFREMNGFSSKACRTQVREAWAAYDNCVEEVASRLSALEEVAGREGVSQSQPSDGRADALTMGLEAALPANGGTIISGSPGPLYSAGFHAGYEHARNIAFGVALDVLRAAPPVLGEGGFKASRTESAAGVPSERTATAAHSQSEGFVLGETWPDWFAVLHMHNIAVTGNIDARWRGGPDYCEIRRPDGSKLIKKRGHTITPQDFFAPPVLGEGGFEASVAESAAGVPSERAAGVTAGQSEGGV